MTQTVRIGTRRSELALAQARQVAAALARLGVRSTTVAVTSAGDTAREPLSKLGTVGVFAARLRTALLENECDIAVHSFKDLPTQKIPGLETAAVPKRETAADVLITASGAELGDLRQGAKIGTGSPRRAAQLKRLRPDLRIMDIRGNIGTRISRVRGLHPQAEGDLDAVVLAHAGLIRLGRTDIPSRILPILPAPAQGALAVECRSQDCPAPEKTHPLSPLARALENLNDPESNFSASAERAVLAGLQAGCAAPVGAVYENGILRAGVFSPDGSSALEAELSSAQYPHAGELGLALASLLLERGAESVAPLHLNKTRRSGGSGGDISPFAGSALWREEKQDPTAAANDISAKW